MSLINSLGKHPASNTSCLDGEAMTSPAAPSSSSFSPIPLGAHLGQGQGMPDCGVCAQGRQHLVLHLQKCCIAAVFFGFVSCPGSPEGKSFVLAASLWA